MEALEMKTLKHLKIYLFGSLMMVLFLVTLAVDASAYQTKSNKKNSVRVDVRPVQLLPGKTAKFEIRMNSHSGDLSQDLIAVCSLWSSPN
jgi:hypothetical protein